MKTVGKSVFGHTQLIHFLRVGRTRNLQHHHTPPQTDQSVSIRRLTLRRASKAANSLTLKDADVKISLDGKGCWVDNRLIERLWRSLKYECIYLNAFETGSQARAGIRKWLAYYNTGRPHSTHGILTPDDAYERKQNQWIGSK